MTSVRTIAFTDRVNKGHVVFLMDSDGRNRRQLTAHEREIGAVTPTWSPDGRRLLYSDQVGQALELRREAAGQTPAVDYGRRRPQRPSGRVAALHGRHRWQLRRVAAALIARSTGRSR